MQHNSQYIEVSNTKVIDKSETYNLNNINKLKAEIDKIGLPSELQAPKDEFQRL